MNLLEFALTNAVLRYDDPLTHNTLDEGTMALTLSFDVVSRKLGDWKLFAEDFSLDMPDGSSIAADVLQDIEGDSTMQVPALHHERNNEATEEQVDDLV